jgi:hypothetical protein
MTPAWILDVLAGVMLAVAAVSAARLVAARPWRRGSVIVDADVAHLLMAIAMAGVLAPSLRTLPSAAWEVIFGVLIAWFAFRVVRDARVNGVRALAGGHCAPHLVHSGSMLYMFLATTSAAAAGMAGMAGMSAASGSMLMLSYPTLAFAFVLILVGYSIWDLDQLSGRRYSLASTRVSLAEIGAGVPAMAGAEPAPATFSGPRPAPAVTDAFTDAVMGAPAVTIMGATAGPGPRAADGQLAGCGSAPTGANGADGAFGEFLLSPAVTVGCRIAMGVAMAFMLIVAI